MGILTLIHNLNYLYFIFILASKTTKSSKSNKNSPKKEPKNINKMEEVKFEPQIDDGTYKAPEYYQHNQWTFCDYMINLNKYRLPQPVKPNLK